MSSLGSFTSTFNNSKKSAQVTLRGTIVGLLIGTLILLSNFQFGLQTGWVSMMSLPAALLAYSLFKIFNNFIPLKTPFTPQENVYVQSVAVAVATGPLAYGFIGIIPAIEKLLTPEEAGILQNDFSSLNNTFNELEEVVFQPFKPWWKLIIWGTGLAFFGVFFAIPLREEFIIRQNLKFPSGSATATLISVFHDFPLRLIGRPSTKDTLINNNTNNIDNENDTTKSSINSLSIEEREIIRLGMDVITNPNSINDNNSDNDSLLHQSTTRSISEEFLDMEYMGKESYSRDMILLSFTALISSIYTLTTYFIPQIRTIPIFGNYLSNEYLINFTPSPAYVGQGIIMGFQTTCGMIIGMIIGWFILSPIAKWKGWAPGETGDWKDGSEGWIMWISLSIMIADSIVSLGLITYNSLNSIMKSSNSSNLNKSSGESSNLLQNEATLDDNHSYSSTENNVENNNDNNTDNVQDIIDFTNDENINDLKYGNDENEESIPASIPTIGLMLCCPLLIISMKIIFGSIIPPWILLLTIPVSLVLSLIGVKSLGETDLNPVSGIGKLSQLLTALVIPSSRPGAVLINLVVGALSEATAQQAGDLMQDLKTGFLLHGSPQAQFMGQIFGSIWGILIAAPMYRWYDKIYQIPGPIYKIPTAVIWIDCARLVNGHQLPKNVDKFVLLFGIIFFILSLIRGINKDRTNKYTKYTNLIPSGVAVGIGIYNTPSFTLARFVGGIISLIWMNKIKNKHVNKDDSHVSLIIFSSGLVLGEGLFSVVNMILASCNVPHL